MRRSLAPSIKGFPDIRTKENSSNNSNSDKGSFVSKAVRSTSSILDLIAKEDEPSTDAAIDDILNVKGYCDRRENIADNGCAKQEERQEQLTAEIEQSEKRTYNVVWGKQSTKKHKTWEGDGILEVDGKVVILKDSEGKIMGRSTNAKIKSFEDGSRFFFGGKEVEIVDMISNQMPPSKRPMEPVQESTVVTKKAKFGQKSNIHNYKYKPLFMPQPSNEHRWELNPNRLPLGHVQVDPCLARVLRNHQRDGVIFLYECVLGLRKQGHYGAILADEMGLGKTLQCITLVWTLLKQGPYGGNPLVKNVLIITPSSLASNWQKEFKHWLGFERISVFVVNQKNKPKAFKDLWNVHVMITSYEMFSRYISDIESIGFDLVICDEGHRLKNSVIKISTLLFQFPCKKRILLSGTPIQNDLQEFYTLANFVNPGVLGSLSEFRKYYEDPIVASRQPNADEDTQKLGKERAAELNHSTSWFILRRTQDIIDKFLPTKTDIVVFTSMSPFQHDLYKMAVKYWEQHIEDGKVNKVPHLTVITALRKICSHPSLIRTDALEDSLNNELLSHMLASENKSLKLEDTSGKVAIVKNLMKYFHKIKVRAVLVSYFTQTLDLLVNLCESHGYKYCRLDGSTASNVRQQIVDDFNVPHSRISVFLLSARAGGVGLNLIGASRLVLFDSDWNPASDLQAMSRIWRDGQKLPVFIYRLLSAGTIEEKIFQRQISKTGLSGAVVDPQNSSKICMSLKELKDLFSYNDNELCLTHSILKCKCTGNGEVSINTQHSLEDNVENIRSCQLGQKFNALPNSSSMTQLLEWEHYRRPVDLNVLKDVGLEDAAHLVAFLFKTTSLSYDN